MSDEAAPTTRAEALQAVLVWVAFIVANALVHATIPFALGANVRSWTYSQAQFMLSGLIVYGGFFLVAPLVMVKGWQTVRRPAFLLPLLCAVVAAGLWYAARGIGVVIVVVLAYLHWRYDLSELGIRSSGWRGDGVAVLLVAGLYTIPSLLGPVVLNADVAAALRAGLFRLFGNPATTAEYLFYFGFLATRLSKVAGPFLAAVLIGVMYTTHEMINPEYWYENVQFAFIFVGVAVATAIYLWRRSLIPLWLGDGLSRFLRVLLG